MKRLFITLLAAMCGLGLAKAQILVGGGALTGSVESNSIYYFNDPVVGEELDATFGSNNHIKIDYNRGRLSAGLQGDIYLPALQGYELRNYGAADPAFALATKFISYRGDNFGLTLGDFYDQFGNGLVYRSFEDRQLGLNNSTEGLRATFKPTDYLSLKAIVGRPRLYLEYAESLLAGVDASMWLSDVLGWNEAMMAVEASYLMRYESLDKQDMGFGWRGLETPLLNLWSARTSFDWKGMTLKAEYAGKSADLGSVVADQAKPGTALLAEAGYTKGTFSVMAQTRILSRMSTMLSLYGSGTGNMLNYLPALTRQHTYMLANLNPLQVIPDGEIGAQIDVFYKIRNRKVRYDSWTLHANFSTAYTLRGDQAITRERLMFWRDFNFDVERQWSREWKATFFYSLQQFIPHNDMAHPEVCTSNIFVGDVSYKINKKNSVRVEAQYLFSNDYEGDWVAALVEFNMAPRWSIFVSDMYNHQRLERRQNYHNGVEKINYYSVGASYTQGRTRAQLSYGRNRAGMVCSGGVCRYSPAYTGLNLMLSTSF